MIGCASQQFNWAIQAILRDHTALLVKVHTLMTMLNTIKNRHRLREVDACL
ncbi:hypothetical protein JG687_00002447 [Phytophthora cactorum]|uniref:Uncharacterized protein n=1 Tax=Phytophthora cactorum TaxID=29920 RepID=A0A8T1UWV8_9STRA|nr:hypothetical protein JG687_00002447 [Phytophthora cactorum]